ncbi:3-dehydroquinate synthase [Lysinibacillus piscis]|uniref:3-dehydroquinate synthase n=1 Tax=Lysinibacillus piscis TaxID=2518931 RepID=A0ABQ5NG35_9BACI|nr:3-dehydroquinate synthase [Lysinibacillus sp. KH24]GLC87063.1 3-dehydroquinate synthase [Lysinibacillus sp. KH24]
MRVPVATKSHQYEVVLGYQFLTEALQVFADKLQKADKLIVFTDEHVWAAQGENFQANFPYPFDVFVLPNGEEAKTFEQYYAAHTFLLEHECSRKSFIFAFGGGAVGDVTGFVAATFMRGIPFIQIPTTILAHDSAVGGKTAINHPLGKNMIGAFYQPEGVIYDIAFLASLPEREVRSGTAEMIKHAMISDAAWLTELMTADSVIHFSTEALAQHLQKGIEVKSRIVAEDETEQSVRKFLNLGHTYGHAIEAAAGYGKVAHGEAVMIGLVYCLLLSERYGDMNRAFTTAFLQFAAKNGYPFDAVQHYSFDELVSYLMKDKKTEYGVLQFVLLQEIGRPFVKAIDVAECREVDAEFRQLLAEVLV